MTTAPFLDSRYSWVRLGITLLIATVGNVGMWAIIVIMPAVQAEFGIDRAGASFPYTMTMVGFALGNFVIGRAVDRFGITAGADRRGGHDRCGLHAGLVQPRRCRFWRCSNC